MKPIKENPEINKRRGIGREGEAQERKEHKNSATTHKCAPDSFFKEGSRCEKRKNLISESLDRKPMI